ncbi:MAG: anhydro-N-acetylmuramic acid kinase [Stenotrophobium sp.]
MHALYIGLMSGTSMDGVDAALCEFEDTRFVRVVASHSVHYPDDLRARLLHLQRDTPAIPLRDYAELNRKVAETFVLAVAGLLKQQRIDPAKIVAIGSHGQTVFHDPSGVRSSLQAGDPNLIAADTGITTVADFRRRDIALGGQGAPLVPAFHHALFAAAGEQRCVVNIGGIANITLLDGDDLAHVRGFDTGPGNGLMDEWTQRHLGRPYDADGAWAASAANADEEFLAVLLADDYFRAPPPKSTGRDRFNLNWALSRYPQLAALDPAAVQRSFCELSARSIADMMRSRSPQACRVLICGGGARNGFLMRRLHELLKPVPVEPTDRHGLDALHVEAAAFAWLAMRTLHGLSGNLPAVTGARQAAVLGGIYRA